MVIIHLDSKNHLQSHAARRSTRTPYGGGVTARVRARAVLPPVLPSLFGTQVASFYVILKRYIIKGMFSKTCQKCGKTFYKKMSTSMRNWQEVSRYCSRRCTNDAKIGKPSWNKNTTGVMKANVTSFKKGHVTVVRPESIRCGSENNRWKGGKVSKDCAVCKKTFVVDRYRTKSAKTCSRKCAETFCKDPEQRERMSKIHREKIAQGVHNSFWGYTKLVDTLRHCSLYRQWRETVFKRDDYSCQECGNRGGTLNADHITPFASILFAHDIKSFDDARKCKELWNLDNGRTLCRKCHKKTPTFAKRLDINSYWNRKINYMKKNITTYLSKEFPGFEIKDIDKPITGDKLQLQVVSIDFKSAQTDILTTYAAVTSINSLSLFDVARDMRVEIYQALGRELDDNRETDFWSKENLELAQKRVVL